MVTMTYFKTILFYGAVISFCMMWSLSAHAQTPPCSTSAHAGASYDNCTGNNCERMICNGTSYVPASLWNNQGYSSIKFGPDSSACNNSRLGRMRYNPTDPNPWSYCDGVNWTSFNIMGENSNLTCWGDGWYSYQNSVPVKFNKVYSSYNILYGIFSNRRMGVVTGQGSYPSISEPDYVKKISAGRYFYSCSLLINNSAKCFNGEDVSPMLSSWTSGLGTNVADISTSLTATWESKGHTCAVLTNGDLSCTASLGDNENGVADNRPGLNASKVALGEDHTCVLKNDGSVQCWNISSTPTVTDAIEIVAGGDNDSVKASCLLRATGAIQCWGNGPVVSDIANAPSNATKIVMSMNGTSACAIRSNGTIGCWGTQYTTNEGNKKRTLASANITTAKDIAIFQNGGGCAIVD
jgi:hypothetical protein